MNSPQRHALSLVLTHIGSGSATSIRSHGDHGWQWFVEVPGEGFFIAFTGTIGECNTLDSRYRSAA